MLLFSREVRLNGSRLREAMAVATQIAEHVSQTTGLAVELWAQVYSPQPNTLAYTAFVDDMTALEAAMDKLMVDDGYHDLTERATQYGVPGSVRDSLGTVIHPAEPAAGTERMTYARVVRSTALISRLGDAIELGVRVAARCQETTGAPSLFLVEETGSFVGVTWIYGHADAADAERFNVRLSEDGGLRELTDRTGDLFVAGKSTRTLYRRVI